MAKKNTSEMELREEYINYMMATGGKDKKNADKKLAAGLAALKGGKKK